MNNNLENRMLWLQQGITLVELIFTLAIAAIVLTVAIPSLSSLIDDIQMTSTLNKFVGNLHFARNEAIKQYQKIVLCSSSNGTDCDNSNEWHRGLMIFVDSGDTLNSRDNGEEILRALIPFSEQISITSNNQGILWFLPTGTSNRSNATITFCHQSSHIEPRAVVISNTRTRISDDKVVCD